MNWWVWPLIILSALGLLSSSVINLYARLGRLTDIGQWESVLGIGIFVVFIPGFFVSGLHDKSVGMKEYWKRVVAVLGTCPIWLKYLIIAIWLYGALCAWTAKDWSIPPPLETDFARVLMGTSGIYMGMYAVSLAMLYSSTDEKFRERMANSQNGDVGA